MKFLLNSYRSRPQNKLFFFFNARGAELERSVVGMYRSLLLQLLGSRPALQIAFDAAGFMGWNINDNHAWTVDSLKQVFEESVCRIGESDSVTCFIDALDECPDTEVRDMVQFFEHLTNYVVQKRARSRILFSSRHYPHITIARGLGVVLESRPEHSQDINAYIEGSLRVVQDDVDHRKQIMHRIQEKASGVFMWVVLVVDILNTSHDEGRPPELLDKELEKLPDNLHALFQDILTRDEKHKDQLLLCLQWVLFARRPLSPKELYYAIHSGVSTDYLSYTHYTLPPTAPSPVPHLSLTAEPPQ